MITKLDDSKSKWIEKLKSNGKTTSNTNRIDLVEVLEILENQKPQRFKK